MEIAGPLTDVSGGAAEADPAPAVVIAAPGWTVEVEAQPAHPIMTASAPAAPAVSNLMPVRQRRMPVGRNPRAAGCVAWSRMCCAPNHPGYAARRTGCQLTANGELPTLGNDSW
jgi:hypothetical protein